MKKFSFILLFLSAVTSLNAQTFQRSELPTPLTTPWAIVYGPDAYLWVSDSGGRVSRINSTDGNRIVVYTAPDYFNGSPLEQSSLCFQPQIGSGTLGLTLHPDFMNPASSFIYFVYSYNSGTALAPATKFKVKRLKWDAVSNSVTNETDLITMISTGYDHLGGNLLAVKRNNISYLFLSVGDHGISDINSPSCYLPQSTNPNNFAQDPSTDNGKIHRYNIDGSIPFDNPIAGNSFYTRGHRNPQGLIYNPNMDILYAIEHGDRTDDEINTLYKGMNYGWKYVRGYHADNNFSGEAAYIANYVPNPNIANDSLVEAYYSWCDVMPDTSSNYLDWCTVAPSGGIYYGSTSIPGWTHSLLVVTLKNGLSTDQQLYQFKLQSNGKLVPSTSGNPNPKKFFAADQVLNGRLRGIAVSPDGENIYLINNGGLGTPSDKITVYKYDTAPSGLVNIEGEEAIQYYPNPANEYLIINSIEPVKKIRAYNMLGVEVIHFDAENITNLDVSHLDDGIYLLKLTTQSGSEATKRITKH